MLLATHILASTATIILVANLITHIDSTSIIYLILGTILSNIIIDIYGHNNVNNVQYDVKRRNMIHSVTGVLFITIIVSALVVIVSSRISLVNIIVLAVANMIHLLLDFVTNEGIYIRGRTRSLSYIRYDDPVANALVSVLSLAVLLFNF